MSNFLLDHSKKDQRQKQNPKQLHFDLISMSYTKLLFILVQSELVIPIFTEFVKSFYPQWYDENAYCEFHLGVQGHSIENCKALKHQVQALIEWGYMNFQKESEEGLYQIESIPMTYTNLFPHLIANHMVKPIDSELPFPEWYNPVAYYEYHGGMLDHSIEDCVPFKDGYRN